MNNNSNTDLSIEPSTDLCGQKDKTNAYFTVQGFLENNYYFYVKRIDRVVSIKTNQFKQCYLLKLAPIEYWRELYATTDKRIRYGIDWNQAEIELMTKCFDKGEFQGAAIRTRAVRHSAKNISLAKNVEAA